MRERAEHSRSRPSHGPRADALPVPLLDVCPLSALPVGKRLTVEHDDQEIMVVNCGGTILAMEDRCSHDDGDLSDGELDAQDCTIECPRHGAIFDLRTGRPMTLPAYQPVDTFPVVVDGDTIKLEVD
jgi:3-phenylpropionate/trans-cinnamate dioxygenase ferredoxin subunit